jgi:cell division transport system ATP-binding protein
MICWAIHNQVPNKPSLSRRTQQVIDVEQVSKEYSGGYQALSNVSFALKPGELAFLTGHSGAGKSTLLKLLTAVEPISRGRVFIDGQDIGLMKRRLVPYFRRRVGVVYQDHKLLNDYTVFENVALPLVVSGTSRRTLEKRVSSALNRVGLVEMGRMHPLELSGGEQQRVGIARAIVNRPSLLLADEPTGNLDPRLADEIMTLFRDLNEKNVTVLVATHNPRHFAGTGERVLELNKGNLVYDSPMRL